VINNKLLALYRSHFAGTYANLKQEIEQLTSRVESYADQSAVLSLERTTNENARLLMEWKEYITSPEVPSLDVPRIQEALG
jgi:hypothetical protein